MVFQFEIIMNVLVRSFRNIWIPMLWVYDDYKYCTLSVRGSTVDVIFWRLQSVPALKGLGANYA